MLFVNQSWSLRDIKVTIKLVTPNAPCSEAHGAFDLMIPSIANELERAMLGRAQFRSDSYRK